MQTKPAGHRDVEDAEADQAHRSRTKVAGIPAVDWSRLSEADDDRESHIILGED
ncbi:hypothetical protein K7472_01015 [Streptomyces sp. PTM05]|uniref:Uncharacterized protein n=1 Tax=Streptantibioticus parmotrematis TaxID=2873249 RepID=A0ABS7QNI3_9ACTN|nr:hypothetical protein [Streptantibioticus parmotrematis]MBY8883427.1 hypothetical protein [Streptantibioticus parmotrematis]